MSWLTRVRNALPFGNKRETPENLWVKCPRCQESAKGLAPDVTEAVGLGLVTWEGYGAPKLTEAGRTRLAEMTAGGKG